jgi:long-subunit fatty acid transport protein
MRKVGLVSLVLMLCAINAMAQSNIDFNILGAGARARGMGGAFIGVADDATAIGWNPAGIAQLDKMEASAVGLFNTKKATETENWNYPLYTWDSTASSEASANHIAPSFFSLVIPFKATDRNVVIGVAYNRLIDMGWARSKDTTYPAYSVERNWKGTGGVDAITPALAVQLTPKFSIGLAGNIVMNGYKETYDANYSDGDYYKTTYEESYSGFNLNSGLLAQLNKQLTVGAMFRFPFTLTVDDVKSSYSSSYAGSGSGTGQKYEISMPMMFGVGMAFRPSENMTLAFDYERRNYSSTEMTGPYSSSGGDTTYNWGMRDVNQFRVGMEYLFIGQSAVFPVRLGFRTNPQIWPAETWNEDAASNWTADSTGLNGMVFTGGFGMKFGNIWFDVAGEYGLTTTSKWERFDYDGYTYKDEIKENSLNILASCIFHF